MSAALSLFDWAARRDTPAPALTVVAPVLRRQPRYYQRDAFTQALEDFKSCRSTLAVMATGTGKTFTAAQVIKAWPGSVLWLNERDNLVTQVRGELEDMLAEAVYVDQADLRAPRHARVVVGSLQTVCQPRRLNLSPTDRYSLIVADEAHHSVAESYRRIFARYPDAKILGLTATPDRLDGRAMGMVYDAQCADYQMLRGIEDGYLVPVRQLRGRRIDVSKLKARGEFSDDQVASVMGDDVLHGIVEDVLGNFEERRGVLYFPRVDIAHVAAEIFNSARPGIARAVDGSLDRDLKRAILRGHKAGDFLLLCNVGVVEEGHDDSGISFGAMCRPTKSRAKFTQWAGRLTRPGCNVDQYATAEERRAAIAASAKPFGLLYDFVGNTGKHRLVSLIDALAGTHDDEEVIARATSILDADERGDAEAALAKARQLTERERKDEAARVARVAAAKYEWRDVDPFEAFGIDEQSDVATSLNRASERQRAMLRHHGLRPTASLTFQDAQRLIRSVKARERAGLSNFFQIRSLSKRGVAAQHMYFETARNLLTAFARAGRRGLSQAEIDAIVGAGRTVGYEG